MFCYHIILLNQCEFLLLLIDGRSHLAKIQANQKAEREEKAQELARAAQEATFKQLEIQIQSDCEVLRKRLGSGQDQAVETAKDLKYVRERQQIHALGVSKPFFQFECFLFLYRVSS